MIKFFALQGIAVLLESSILSSLTRLSPGKDGVASLHIWRWFGYVWVVGWLLMTGPLWMEPLITVGLGQNVVHFSPVFGILEGRWMVSQTS